MKIKLNEALVINVQLEHTGNLAILSSPNPTYLSKSAMKIKASFIRPFWHMVEELIEFLFGE